ncbi:hypothetical protein NL676_015928 [Syzygium grande]|nr:hypothetical protein NL676_015928 [Syzygium grande]
MDGRATFGDQLSKEVVRSIGRPHLCLARPRTPQSGRTRAREGRALIRSAQKSNAEFHADPRPKKGEIGLGWPKNSTPDVPPFLSSLSTAGRRLRPCRQHRVQSPPPPIVFVTDDYELLFRSSRGSEGTQTLPADVAPAARG